MLTDTSLLAHLEAVERLFGVDVSELSVVPATKPGDVVYRELASDEGEKRYVVRRLGGGERSDSVDLGAFWLLLVLLFAFMVGTGVTLLAVDLAVNVGGLVAVLCGIVFVAAIGLYGLILWIMRRVYAWPCADREER